MKSIKSLIGICLCSLSFELYAAISPDYKDVDFDNLPKAIAQEPMINESTIINLIPYKKLSEDDTESMVQSKILDQGVNSLLKSDAVQNSALGQTAKTIESSLQADMEIPKSTSTEVSHRFSFQYQAFQREAKIRYRGYFDFDIKYNTSNSDYMAEISQDFDGKQLVLGHEAVSYEAEDNSSQKEILSSISMRWNW